MLLTQSRSISLYIPHLSSSAVQFEYSSSFRRKMSLQRTLVHAHLRHARDLGKFEKIYFTEPRKHTWCVYYYICYSQSMHVQYVCGYVYKTLHIHDMYISLDCLYIIYIFIYMYIYIYISLDFCRRTQRHTVAHTHRQHTHTHTCSSSNLLPALTSTSSSPHC